MLEEVHDSGKKVGTYPRGDAFLLTRRPDSNPASSASLAPGGLTLPFLLPKLLPTRSFPLTLNSAATCRSSRFCTSLKYSYSTPSPTITKNERTKDAVEVMCHERNTTQVFSIWVFLVYVHQNEIHSTYARTREDAERTRAYSWNISDSCPYPHHHVRRGHRGP